jgi:predicted membrane channel-forming protein YqfA (hemolysin III family)
LEYAFLLGAEGFGAFWWGSARRLRRFLYAGMGGVILAVLGQLINSLRSINQWIVFGIIGLLLVIVAIFVERKLEEIKLFWQEKILETWE